MTTMLTVRADIAQLLATPREITRYHAEIAVRSAILFGVMVACHYAYLPLWVVVLVNVVVYPGIYLRVHDIGHAVPEKRLRWPARFIPVSTPLWGGTRVFAFTHQLHHTYLGTDRDPWLPYYAGHPLRALFFNFIEPERNCWQFLRRRGLDREMVLNALCNAASLVACLALFHWTYAFHLLSQRLAHMTGIFFFNFYTHRESLSAKAPIGSFERAATLRSALPLLRALWGAHVVDGLIYHNRHHCMGQTSVPVRNYRHLSDTGVFCRFNTVWPLSEIKRL